MPVSFEVWTTESILRASVVEVTSSKCLLHGVPVKGGLRDPRFGVLGKGRCTTCGKGRVGCFGHWGHIVLKQPMYHISWMTHTLHWLRCLCEGCGKLRGKGSLRDRASRSHRVCECGTKAAKYAWDKHRACVLRNGELYPPSMALARFKAYRGDLCPSDIILTVFPVPPLHVRPPLISGGQTRGEDDLTYRLQNILRKNELLGKCLSSQKPDIVCDQAREGLQNALTGYINHNKLQNRRHRNKREYTSLTGRLSSKEGRVRGNLMGKRSNFTARSVITPDDRLALGEIGIPSSVARTLTKCVKVTRYNKRLLEEQVESGAVRYVSKPDGSRIDTSIRKPSLEVGWTVERSMVNGDVVLFNRQPSLHKMSMMAHVVRILPYDTFRMNVSCTAPYNADFDGDEMNVHFPQTIMAESEAREIMAVKHQIVSPQSNKPVMGLIQDGLLGMYLLSGATLTRDDAMCILNAPLPYQLSYSGNDVISEVLPDITYRRGDVQVVRGRVVCGRFIKRDLGTAHGSLIHVMYNDLGPDVCVRCMHAMQRLAHAYLALRGFTIGLGDLVRSDHVTQLCVAERESAYEDVVGQDEARTNNRLNNCRNVMGKAAMDELDDRNNLFAMVHCGSKGSMVNITQLQACLGQQNLRGGRIPKEWSNRTMTHFQPGDAHPRTRGFIESCYLEGLKPHEMYFHAQSGREGLIDTAIKTAETGYIERKLSKALENIRTHADGSCRDGGRMICFQYGDDGVDAMRVEKQRFAGFPGPDTDFVRAIRRDPSTEGTDWYHLPIPIARILDKIPHGDTQMVSFELDMFVSQFPPLLGAWIRAHTPTMDYADFCTYRDMVMTEWTRAKVCPGESVGALAAQSIGERTTQCTLNSVDYNEHLVMYNVAGCIGEVIDGIIDRARKTGEVIHVRTQRLRALTFDADGNVSWRKVTAVTRHPPENEDGSNLLVKITTRSGRTLTCTRAKSFMVLRFNRWKPIRGCELEVGDAVPIIGEVPEIRALDPIEGYAIGVFMATGTCTPYPVMFYDTKLDTFLASLKCPLAYEGDRVTVYSERLRYAWANLTFPSRAIGASRKYVQMLLLGYVEHCSVVENGGLYVEAHGCVRDGLSLLLSTMGVPHNVYPRGFVLHDMCALCSDRTLEDVQWVGGTWADPIVKIEAVPSSHPYVYDLTVEGTKNMVALNGIGCRDTFHFAGDSSKNVTLGIPRMEEILNLSKRMKTPLRTYQGPVLPRYVRVSDVLVRRGPVQAADAALLAGFWEFPDPGAYEGTVERWELYPWHDVEALRQCVGVDIAYTQGPRVVCHVYGFQGDVRDLVLQGVPGGEWCKSVGDHVETSLTVHQLWNMLDDPSSVYSNDVMEMHRTYGIEAARACILKEIRKILAHYGIYVNARHLLLLVDWMTFSGLTPLTRHGMKRLQETPLKRSTFEEVVDVFHQAALTRQSDPVEGISACILTGKEAQMGSNLVTVLKDEVMERQYKVPYPSEDIEMFSWIPKCGM